MYLVFACTTTCNHLRFDWTYHFLFHVTYVSNRSSVVKSTSNIIFKAAQTFSIHFLSGVYDSQDNVTFCSNKYSLTVLALYIGVRLCKIGINDWCNTLVYLFYPIWSRTLWPDEGNAPYVRTAPLLLFYFVFYFYVISMLLGK